jgi:hypothetical protein
MSTGDEFDVAVDVLRAYFEHLAEAHRMIDLRGVPACARCATFREELGPDGGPLPAGATP